MTVLNGSPGYRPGACVKDDKLYVFSRQRVVVIRGWPTMAAWTKTSRRPRWVRFRPKISLQDGEVEPVRSQHRYVPPLPKIELAWRESLVIPRHLTVPSEELCDYRPIAESDFEPPDAQTRRQEEQKQLIRNYFSNIPSEIRETVLPFANRQWHLLSMVARVPETLELLQSNSALAFALGSLWIFDGSSSRVAMQRIRRLIRQPRRIIAGHLGFPATNAAVRVLQKIPARLCCIPWLLALREAFPAWQKTLSHLPSCNDSVIHFLCVPAYRRRATPALLHQLASHHGEDSFSYVMEVIRELERNYGYRGTQRFTRTIDLSDHVLRLIWKYECERQQPAAGEDKIPLPPPPIPGNDMIQPLETEEQICEEARIQRNCLDQYPPRVANGRIYLYRVLSPERATLSIVQGRNGRWKIDQLLKAGNRPVSDATRQIVELWLKRFSKTECYGK